MIRSAFSIGAVGMLIGIAVLLYRSSDPSEETTERAHQTDISKAPAPPIKSPEKKLQPGPETAAPVTPTTGTSSQRAPQWVRPAPEATPFVGPPAPDQSARVGPQQETTGEDQEAKVAERVLDPNPGAVGSRTHKVVAGDTLWGISRRYYGTPKVISRIVAANGLKNGTALYPGQILVLPGDTNAPPADADHETASAKPKSRETVSDPERVEEFQPMPPSLSRPIRIMP